MSKGEEQIAKILTKAKISFEREKTFRDLKKGTYRYDFYIDNYENKSIIIEVNGLQHYQYIPNFYPSERWWRAALERDRRKISYALANNITIYIIPYWELSKIKKINDILKEEYHAKSRWHNDDVRRALKSNKQ